MSGWEKALPGPLASSPVNTGAVGGTLSLPGEVLASILGGRDMSGNGYVMRGCPMMPGLCLSCW